MARKKILLVDDSNTVLMLHRMMLAEVDCELLVARNGKEAVEKATSSLPDLIFMDLVMPVMNGFDATKAIRACAQTRAVPILMVTTRGEPLNIEAGYLAGCTEYVTKPFDRVELMAKLKHYLGQ